MTGFKSTCHQSGKITQWLHPFLIHPPNHSWRKSFGKSHIATPHRREWTHPLRVQAVQCPLQTSPITQLPVRYIHITRRTHNDGIYCASISMGTRRLINVEK